MRALSYAGPCRRSQPSLHDVEEILFGSLSRRKSTRLLSGAPPGHKNLRSEGKADNSRFIHD
ncbi:hypothetical protein ACFL2Q_04725, partial [Thermodesulfobacteriota bacterium]